MVFYRAYGECKASRSVSAAAGLHTLMRKVSRVGGETQIECALNPRTRRDRKGQGQALVFVGDAMEERADWLCHKAGDLGRGGTHSSSRRKASSRSPRRPARLSGVRRPAVQPRQFQGPPRRDPAFAVGGHAALEDYAHRHSDKAALERTRQLSPSLKSDHDDLGKEPGPQLAGCVPWISATTTIGSGAWARRKGTPLRRYRANPSRQQTQDFYT